MLDPGGVCWVFMSGDAVSMFLLAGLLDHGLHHHGSLLVTFDLAAVGELLHRLHHFDLLIAQGVWGEAARAGAGAGTGAGAGAGTTGRWLWSGPTWAIVIPVLFLGLIGTWGRVCGARAWASGWRDWAWIFGARLSTLMLTFTAIVFTSSTLIIILSSSIYGQRGTERPGVWRWLRRWRSGCDASVRLIGWHHSISDSDIDVAGWWCRCAEAGVRVTAVTGDKDIATFGVKVSDGLRLLILPHSVSDNVTQSVKGFADLSSIWDILWRHSCENRPLLLSLHPFLLHILRGEPLCFIFWSLPMGSPAPLLLATIYHIFRGQLFLLQDLLGQELLAGLDVGDVLDCLGDIWTQIRSKVQQLELLNLEEIKTAPVYQNALGH